MSGVVKDETPSTVSDLKTGGTDDKVPSDLAGSDPATPESAASHARRAPHLRVVTDPPSNLAPSDSDAADVDAVEAAQPQLRMGQVLQQTRLNKGLTLEQVSRETRITVSDLQAIEEMTPSLIRGGEVYIKGHVRNYARHLGLNPDETLARYKADVPLLADPVRPQVIPQTNPAAARATRTSMPVGFIAGASVVAVAAIAAWVFLSGDKDQPKVAAAPDAPAVQSQAPAAARPNAAAPPLRLVALRRAKIVVRGADGTKFLQRYMSPGESYAPRTGAGWTVSADEDGSAFEWRLGDMSLGLLAPEGGPVYAQSVDSALSRTPVGPAVDIAAPAEIDDGLNLDIPGAEPLPDPAIPAAAPPASTDGAASAAAKPKPAAPAPTQSSAVNAPAPTEPAAPAQTPAADPALAAYPQ